MSWLVVWLTKHIDQTACRFCPLILILPLPDDPWFAMDKFQHAAFSFFITTGTQYGLVNKLSLSEGHALPLSIGTSAVAGVSKEVYDMKRSSNPYFSYRDLIADGAGILLAVGLILI